LTIKRRINNPAPRGEVLTNLASLEAERRKRRGIYPQRLNDD
jgi:hypothetical protein